MDSLCQLDVGDSEGDQRMALTSFQLLQNPDITHNPGIGPITGRFVGDTEVGEITSGLRQSGATVGFKVRRGKHLGDE